MTSFRTSRVTLFSFLLAAMLAMVIWLGTQGKQDACSAYLAGNLHAPSTEYVQTGSHTVVVSCNDWLPRQSLRVQILCLLDLVLVVCFMFNALQDVRTSFGKQPLPNASRWTQSK